VNEVGPSNIRVSDPEREDALRMLGEHMATGRLDLTEYGERSAKVAAAKTRGQVSELFADLPDPRPAFGAPAVPAPAPAPVPAAPRQRSVAERIGPILVPIAGVVAVVLFFTVFKFWMIFLLPAVVAALSGNWGGDAHRGRRHGHRRRW
jgi:uncharacterized protein DUF1707